MQTQPFYNQFFLWGYANKIEVKPTFLNVFCTQFIDLYTKELEKADIFEIAKQTDSLSFCGSMFRFAYNGINVFNSITKGEIKIEKSGEKIYLKYKIYFIELFAIALVFTTLPIVKIGHEYLPFILILIIWGVFYTGTVILTVVRYKSLLNSLIHKIIDLPRSA